MTSFVDFVRERWGDEWAICRATPNNKARYARCVSRGEYARAEADYRVAHTADALRDRPVAGLGHVAADLYEALTALRRACESDLRPIGACGPTKQAAHEKAAAAIARAEG